MSEGRSRTPARGRKQPASQRKRHLDDVLDEALEETFPASDTPAVVEPVANGGNPSAPGRKKAPRDCRTRIDTEPDAMTLWLVRATWMEDETEASEQWQVDAGTAHEAIKAVSVHMRFPPHHVEVKHASPDEAAATRSPPRGEASHTPSR